MPASIRNKLARHGSSFCHCQPSSQLAIPFQRSEPESRAVSSFAHSDCHCTNHSGGLGAGMARVDGVHCAPTPSTSTRNLISNYACYLSAFFSCFCAFVGEWVSLPEVSTALRLSGGNLVLSASNSRGMPHFQLTINPSQPQQ